MMEASLPDPLVPPEVNLRDFPCLPIDVVKLFASEFHARSSDGEWRAGVTLWLKSFHQVPAGSLPDDDVALTRLAEFGRDVTAWQEVKVGALRNWVQCSDGRLYHSTVAIKALEAWIGKVWQRRAGAAGNAKRWQVTVDLEELDYEHSRAIIALAALDPKSPVLRKHRPAIAATLQNKTHVDRDPIPCPSRPDSDTNCEPIASEVKGSEVSNIPSSLRSEGPPAIDEAFDAPEPLSPAAQKTDLYRRGKEILGEKSGGFITLLLKAKSENVQDARAALEMAVSSGDAREYLGAIVRGRERADDLRARGEAW